MNFISKTLQFMALSTFLFAMSLTLTQGLAQTTTPLASEKSLAEPDGKVIFLGSTGSIVFPKKPEAGQKELESAQGIIVQRILKCKDNENQRVYLVQVLEYPDKDNFSSEKAFTSTVNRLKTRGKLKAERDVKLGNLNGKEIIVEREDGGAFFRTLVFTDQQKAVGITIEVIATKQDKVESADVNAFLDSATADKS